MAAIKRGQSAMMNHSSVSVCHLKPHGTDGVRDENEAGEVGAVGDPQGCRVGMDPVRNDSVPHLCVTDSLSSIP